MAYNQEYLDYVLDTLHAAVPALNHRPMFGGVGIYSHSVFFALIASDTLYFHVDDDNRADYEALEMGSFGKNYREVPAKVLEDPDLLRQWAEKAIMSVAEKPRIKKPRGKV
jgi:TfoX/Sxy family transcriptional regulator of competence genes